MCEVLPSIDETASPSPDGENSKLEQLMISMLEERDRLMDKLRETQDSYNEAMKKLSQVEADNDVLMRQLQAVMPEEEGHLHQLIEEIEASGGMTTGTSEDTKRWPIAKKFAQLARDLAAAKEKVVEREEEVQELKSERANTRLLLEHLECLVARHERSLRMTVVKRQTCNTGVSSEVEVLKALKSLFDHHKALDEKVRERLRSAQERNVILEDELMLTNQELKTLQDENRRMKRMIRNRNSVRLSVCYDNVSLTKEQLALLEERDQTIGDLQFSIDERDAQLEEAIHTRDELSEKLQDAEEEITAVVKELQSQQFGIKAANKQMSEMLAVRTELEDRVSDLQSQLIEAHEDLAKIRDENQRLRDQLSTQEAKLIRTEEESQSLRAELKAKENSLQYTHAVSQEQMRKHSEQLTQAEMEKDSAESEIQQLRSFVEHAHEKESVNEDHIKRLQSTIERMLKESNDRMKTHIADRKTLSDERAMYQRKAETLEKDLQVSRSERESLQRLVEELKTQLRQQRHGDTASLPRGLKMGGAAGGPRYSWQVTDIDDAIAQHRSSERAGMLNGAADDDVTPTATPTQTLGVGQGAEWELGEEPEGMTSQLLSMIDSQVSKLDKQLESMGENVAEASEFDRVLQSMAEGDFHSAAALETLPLSSPPGSHPNKAKYRPESLPSSIYRVQASDSPEVSPSSSSNESFTASTSNGNDTDKAKLRHKGSFSKIFRRPKKGRAHNHKKHSARRASAPLPTSPRQVSESAIMRESVDFSEFLLQTIDLEEDRSKKSKVLSEVLEKGTPFAAWDSSMVIAWLEVWVGVPYWYIAAIRTSLRSGAMLANISDAELEQELGITNTLHRLKLKLAVQEIDSLTCSQNPQLARTTSLYGEMGHEWIGDYWLPSLGLPRYKEMFKACLVDARMLEHLTKKDLRTVLKMVEASHRNSLQYGIAVLKKLDYNRNELEQRREAVDVETHKDVMVWSCDHVTQWVDSIGLGEYSAHLKEGGVHGGLIALDRDFDYEKLCLVLQIPLTSPEVRKQLKVEFSTLLAEGTTRASSESQSHGRIVRKLSKKLKVGGRKLATPPGDFLPVRPSSPVLFSVNTPPITLHSLMEEGEEEGEEFIPVTSHNGTNSLDAFGSSSNTATELTV